jgi:hypothetical protein
MLSEVLTQAEVELEQGTRVSSSRLEQQQAEDARLDVGLLSAISEQEAASNRTWNKERQAKERGSAYAAAACFASDIAPLIILGIIAVFFSPSLHALHCLHSHRSAGDSEADCFRDIFVGIFLCPFVRSWSTPTFLPGASTSRTFSNSRSMCLVSTVTHSPSATG